ncbi:hypothetical protein AcW1_006578 [Taiwanofungus camphoratus]|nr:hypothetical protein AcW2_005338 [Antrodia cinnamomea]KAI0954800.1 hypothetical protein AcW1_006578 [Antrodia cinnamomea]
MSPDISGHPNQDGHWLLVPVVPASRSMRPFRSLPMRMHRLPAHRTLPGPRDSSSRSSSSSGSETPRNVLLAMADRDRHPSSYGRPAGGSHVAPARPSLHRPVLGADTRAASRPGQCQRNALARSTRFERRAGWLVSGFRGARAAQTPGPSSRLRVGVVGRSVARAVWTKRRRSLLDPGWLMLRRAAMYALVSRCCLRVSQWFFGSARRCSGVLYGTAPDAAAFLSK